jgi:hypothetical protein
MQWPVAYQWAKATGKKFTCWMDEGSCKMVAPLFAAQECVESVEFKSGIEGYGCGGQPWHFDLGTNDLEGHTVYHLGLRSFPVRQLTLQCLEDCKLPDHIEVSRLAQEPSLSVSGVENKNRVVLHGQPVCTHNRQTPQFWKFLASISPHLKANFDEVVFVGDARDREVGSETYPEWSTFDDRGDFLSLARLIAGSRLVIGGGSSVVTVGGALKVPTIRVHDQIGVHPKVIWSNLGDNQLNETEIELRSSWHGFRAKWLEKSTAEVVQ